jgi:hypothetical protein
MIESRCLMLKSEREVHTGLGVAGRGRPAAFRMRGAP